MGNVSNKVIERLTLYHCILTHTLVGRRFISSFEIASLLNLDDSQVRKDIALCNVLGRQKSGYPVNKLKTAIEEKLGFSEHKDVFIVGAGNLGSALIKHSDFRDYGIDILALFDSDVQKIGKKINGRKVFSMEKLSNLVERMRIKTIILTVPPQSAQKVTDDLVQMGIRFIWNFTPRVLKVPQGVIVHYENILSGFLQMKNKIL